MDQTRHLSFPLASVSRVCVAAGIASVLPSFAVGRPDAMRRAACPGNGVTPLPPVVRETSPIAALRWQKPERI